MPAQWHVRVSPDHSVYVDSVEVHSGKYSVVIESKANISVNESQLITLALPNNYVGKKITLAGYIKTQDVAGGYAGLGMHLVPMIEFDDMRQRGITGTTEWTKYEITLPMNAEATQQIVVGGFLSGKGKIWLDDFSITIDGKDVSQAEIFEKPLMPADKDRKFDNGSGIKFLNALTEQQIADLELLGRLWGFLKYHHPTVASGKYNWDYELFRILPKYLKINNSGKRDKLLVDWINGLGKIKSITPTPVSEDAHIKPDLSWMNGLSPTLREAIQHVYDNRNQDKNYYVSIIRNVGNPQFDHEAEYAEMPYPDAGFRLLSLFRFWSSVEYFFPEKYSTDKPWGEVLREYIPIFISAKDELEYEIAALRIICELCDTHANLWNGGDKIDSLRGDYRAPFRVQFIEDKLVVTDYYNPELNDGTKVGDVITHIDGLCVESIVDSLRVYYPASNESARLRDISNDLLRSRKDEISINGKPMRLYHKDSLNIYYSYKVDNDDKCHKILNGNIGYITLANIQDADLAIIKKDLQNTRGIIIDIRNYPLASVTFGLGRWFVSDEKPYLKFSKGSVNNPGEFQFKKPAIIVPATDGQRYKGKLVVLINEITQSQAECTTMALKVGDNTTIIGSQTAGSDGNISTIVLPGGLLTFISGLGVYYPDGKRTQRIGITPDIELRPTIYGIATGRDELLEKAIEIINQN